MRYTAAYIAIMGFTIITCAHLQAKVAQHKAPPIVAITIGERP